MKQRGFVFPLALIPYIIMAVAAAVALWKWAAFKEDLREEGRAEVRAEWQAERTQLIAARDAMVMRWAKAIQEVERVYVETVVVRESRFSAIRSRANSVGVSGSIRLSADAVGVLRDSAGAANATPAPQVDQRPAEAVPESAGDTTAQEWIAFAVDAAEAYRDARDKWGACVAYVGEITRVAD